MADPFAFDPEKLKQESDEAASSKRWLNAFGSAADSLANTQSAADILLKNNPTKVNAGAGFRASADAIQDPAERQAKLYAQYKQAKEAQAMQREDAKLAQLKDPNSAQSKAARYIAQKYKIPIGENASADETSDFIDPKKMLETEAMSAANFDNQRRLKAIEQNYDLEKIKAKGRGAPKGFKYQLNEGTGEMELVPERRLLPAETAGKLGNLLGAADASLKIEDLGGTQSTGKMAAVGDWLKEAVGMQNEDRARFSSDVANQRNAVMSQIAGANVTEDEKSRILEGIPTRTDAPEQFKAKGASTTDGIIRKAEAEITALDAAGYDTAELRKQLLKFKSRLQTQRSSDKKDIADKSPGPQGASAKPFEQMTDAELDAELAKQGLR